MMDKVTGFIDLHGTFKALLAFLMFILGWATHNPGEAFQLFFVILPGLTVAIYRRQWKETLAMAGALAYSAASIAELDKEQKRQWVAMRLRQRLPLWAKPLISNSQIEAAVEHGWHTFAKNRLKEEQPPINISDKLPYKPDDGFLEGG